MPLTVSNNFPLHFSKLIFLVSVGLFLFLIAHPALAAETSGAGLPYESWFTKITQSITGPFAYCISLAGIIGAGAGLIFGGADMNGFLRTLIFLVLALSFIVAAKNTISAITGQGAEIALVSCSFGSA